MDIIEYALAKGSRHANTSEISPMCIDTTIALSPQKLNGLVIVLAKFEIGSEFLNQSGLVERESEEIKAACSHIKSHTCSKKVQSTFLWLSCTSLNCFQFKQSMSAPSLTEVLLSVSQVILKLLVRVVIILKLQHDNLRFYLVIEFI